MATQDIDSRLGPDKRTLFTIGNMAKLFHVNIRTLRYYDEIGIFKPAYIDAKTNYRYYSTTQFERLNTIKYLRALDVPLSKIAEFFEEKDVDTILSLFIEQRKEVRNNQAQLQRIENKITNRIEQINVALTATYGSVSVKSLPQRRIVSLEKSFTHADDFEPIIRDLSKENFLDDAIFLGKVGVSISKQDLEAAKFERFSSMFIIIEDEDNTLANSSILPESTFATVQYYGTHEDAPPYYALLMDYIRSSDYKVAGDSVEITIIDGGITNDREKFTTELQIPLAKKSSAHKK